MMYWESDKTRDIGKETESERETDGERDPILTLNVQ